MIRVLPLVLSLFACFGVACSTKPSAGARLPALDQVNGAQTVNATARLGPGATVETSQLLGLLELRTEHVHARRDAYATSGHYVYNVLLKDAGVTLRDDGSLLLERGVLLLDSSLRNKVAHGASDDAAMPGMSGAPGSGGAVGSLHAWIATAVPAVPTITSVPVALVAKPAPPLVVRPPIVAGSTGTRWAVQFVPASNRAAPIVRVFLRSTEKTSRVWIAPSEDADNSPVVWLDDPEQYVEVAGGKFASVRTLPLTPELRRMLEELDADGADLLVWSPDGK